MLTGSCLCGSVAYEVDAEPGAIVHCHCATCRKAHGSAFSTVTNVPRDRFRWSKGEEPSQGFQVLARQEPVLCVCDADRTSSSTPGSGTILLRMGYLDTPITARPKVHIWRSDGASSFDPKDQLPRWPEGEAPKARRSGLTARTAWLISVGAVSVCRERLGGQRVEAHPHDGGIDHLHRCVADRQPVHPWSSGPISAEACRCERASRRFPRAGHS